jgi:hypothetical protein
MLPSPSSERKNKIKAKSLDADQSPPSCSLHNLQSTTMVSKVHGEMALQRRRNYVRHNRATNRTIKKKKMVTIIPRSK